MSPSEQTANPDRRQARIKGSGLEERIRDWARELGFQQTGFSGGVLNRAEGTVLVFAIVGYTAVCLAWSRRAGKLAMDESESEATDSAGWFGSILLILVGLPMLWFGGDLLVDGAIGLARLIQVSEAVIGLTVVAFGTSVPDLAASAIAARRNKGELAVGNALGSVIFNLLNVLGVASVIRPIKTNLPVSDVLIQIGFLLLVVPMLAGRPIMKRRDGAICVVCYLAYLFVRFER